MKPKLPLLPVLTLAAILSSHSAHAQGTGLSARPAVDRGNFQPLDSHLGCKLGIVNPRACVGSSAQPSPGPRTAQPPPRQQPSGRPRG